MEIKATTVEGAVVVSSYEYAQLQNIVGRVNALQSYMEHNTFGNFVDRQTVADILGLHIGPTQQGGDAKNESCAAGR
nr:MAG TPA: PvuII Restriction endonuclease PvuII [Caudoviricetes sp.]